MNIREAKDQIFNAVKAYRARNEKGNLRIPVERQRPVFLIGAPGIGKTAVVEQVARELGIGFVSYSMTHHTRQSALGLPFIREREYGGRTVRISEYTMSEIIASIYEQMEKTGLKEGLLFLDEINCVSETLTPAMLQFLQYKVFGQHRVPEGWTVVTAGNPPEYNQTVREFDMVTWDRVKRIDVEPDYAAWHDWALNNSVHRSIISYLDLRPDDLYHVEMTAGGRRFVTPRGWTDLSDMISVMEENGDEIDSLLTSQYLQYDVIAVRFADYYKLWKEKETDYNIADILDGNYSQTVIENARAANIEERLTLTNLLIAGILKELETVTRKRSELKTVLAASKGEGSDEPVINADEYNVLLEDFRIIKKTASERLSNLFSFMESAFGDDREMLLLITELTANRSSAEYLALYGSEDYIRHNSELRFYEREQQLIQEIDELGI